MPHLVTFLLATATHAATPTLDDAALWLNTLGVRADLPRLSVRYGSDVQGSDTTFRLKSGEVHELLQHAPTVEWEEGAFGTPQHESEKFFLLMLDPDAPARADDGSLSGSAGPWLHWLVANGKHGSLSTGQTVVSYMPPDPPETGGTHRYIFLLFRQLKPGTLSGYVAGPMFRRKWDVAGFLRDNAGALEPVACNFFYATAERIGGPMDGAAGRADSGLMPPVKSEL